MKRKLHQRKLIIQSETVRELGRKELYAVQGGESSDACTTTHVAQQGPKP